MNGRKRFMQRIGPLLPFLVIAMAAGVAVYHVLTHS